MISDPVTGESLSLLDIHHHLATGEASHRPELLERRLEIMDRHGIDRVCLMPPSGAFGDRQSLQEINDATASLVERLPDRFPAGFAHLDLNLHQRELLGELERAAVELGLRGVVFHHRFQGAGIDHPSMIPIMRRCAELGLPVLVHVVAESTLESAWRLERLLEMTGGELPVIALDALSSSDRGYQMLRAMTRFEQLHIDLGCMGSAMGFVLDEYLREVGCDRILLGTDLYVEPETYHFPFAVQEVAHLSIETEQKKAILAANAARLFGIADIATTNSS
jgi:hypothetical protein